MAEESTTGCDSEKVTLAVAAKAFGVTRRTIERWIEAGRLEKLKDGSKSCVRMGEVRALRAAMKAENGKTDNGGEEITLSLSRFEELISENGALERQAEFLLENLTLKEAREKDLEDARRKILEQERLIGRLEGQLEALKPRVSWWRRIIRKDREGSSDY
jgi:excisionase family DNA binding protein